MERFSEKAIQDASNKVALLQHVLDLTNADHIALWLDEQTKDGTISIPWIACRIAEAHESEIALENIHRGAEIQELRMVLWLLREFMIRNATQWERGANHHHPIFTMVAELVGDSWDINDGAFYKFLQPDNKLTLVELLKEEEEEKGKNNA